MRLQLRAQSFGSVGARASIFAIPMEISSNWPHGEFGRITDSQFDYVLTRFRASVFPVRWLRWLCGSANSGRNIRNAPNRSQRVLPISRWRCHSRTRRKAPLRGRLGAQRGVPPTDDASRSFQFCRARAEFAQWWVLDRQHMVGVPRQPQPVAAGRRQ